MHFTSIKLEKKKQTNKTKKQNLQRNKVEDIWPFFFSAALHHLIFLMQLRTVNIYSSDVYWQTNLNYRLRIPYLCLSFDIKMYHLSDFNLFKDKSQVAFTRPRTRFRRLKNLTGHFVHARPFSMLPCSH